VVQRGVDAVATERVLIALIVIALLAILASAGF